MTVDNTTKHHPCAAALAAQMKLRGIPSQMQLTRDLEAAGLKTSQSTLSLALAGKTPDLSTASKLATFFDVPATTFMPELAVLVPQTAADTGLPRFPLERTRLAKHNERTHYVEEDIHILAADLRDRGLMQNLVGYLDGDVAEVYGGGRRWRALRLLALWGELPDDLQNHGIPFKLYDTRLECLQATVAENAQREDVHFLDRAAALARIREEGGLKAAKIARDLHLGERLVQQLLQIHDRLPDWARDRAFLPKDDPNHLKFRDCRDLVEEKKAAPDPEQEKGADVPLPLAMPAQRFTPDQVAHAAAHLSTQSRPDAEPVSARLRRVLATLHPGADRYGPGDMVWEALPGLDGLDAALAKEFGITTDFLEIHESTTLGSLARWIISQMSIPAPAPVVAVETTTPAEDSTKLKQQMELARAASRPEQPAIPAHPHLIKASALGPSNGRWRIEGLWPSDNRLPPKELRLVNDDTGQEVAFTAAQRDIEDGGGANAVLQEMQRRGFNLYNAFAGTSGRIDSIVVMRTTDRSTTTYVPQHAAPGAGED